MNIVEIVFDFIRILLLKKKLHDFFKPIFYNDVSTQLLFKL